MPRTLNALIVDDNEEIARHLCRRINRASEANVAFTNLAIVSRTLPHNRRIDPRHPKRSASAIEAEIKENEIDILFLDRRFYGIIDPATDRKYANLNKAKLYLRKKDPGECIEHILRRVPAKAFDGILGVIVYTYSEDDDIDEPTVIRAALREILPYIVESKAIKVIETHSEIYRLAKRKLYCYKSARGHPKLQRIGSKADFVLYGLFMGELLYHHTVSLIKRVSVTGTNVFIGHGRSMVWEQLRDFVHNDLHLPWDEFNRIPVPGISNSERLSEMLKEAAFAFLIFTSEDKGADGDFHPRMNVVHEVGLFQAQLGFHRAIVLLEDGCKDFSNIQGVGHIRFSKGNLSKAFEEIRNVLQRERLGPRHLGASVKDSHH